MSLQMKFSCEYPGCGCGYFWCRGQKVENKRFFKFPNNPKVAGIWKQICDIDDGENCTNKFICEDHFEEKDFVNSSKHALNPCVFPKDKLEVLNTKLIRENPVESFETVMVANNDEDYGFKIGESYFVENNLDDKKMIQIIIPQLPEPGKSECNFSNPLEEHSYCLKNNIVCIKSEDDIKPSTAPQLLYVTKTVPSTVPLSVPITCMTQTVPAVTVTIPRIPKNALSMTPTVASVAPTLPITDTIPPTKTLPVLTPIMPMKRKPGFLTEVGASSKDMTPREKAMYKLHRKTASKICKLQRKLQNKTNALKEMKERYDKKIFEYIDDELSDVATNFINSQLRNVDRPAHARRWTEPDKTFALSLYKRSPQMYRYLFNYFHLPTIRTLKGLLSKMPFEPGPNKLLLQQLKIKVDEMNPLDRYCSLIFSDMPLNNVSYDDLIKSEPGEVPMNHAFLVMINGLRKKWSYVVAYYVTQHAIVYNDFKMILMDILYELNGIGIKIKAVVCDKNPVHRRVLTDLCEESTGNANSFTFDINNESIVVIHDTSYLLDCTLTAIVSYNILFTDSKIAQFEHIRNAFDIDKSRQFRQLNKLRDRDFDTIQSTSKTEVASRIFSSSVAAAINSMTVCGFLPSEALDTANFTQTINDVFESLSGYVENITEYENSKNVLKVNSTLLDFWKRLLPEMTSWKLIDLQNGGRVRSTCIFAKYWIVTIQAVINLWQQLQKVGYKSLNLRNLNRFPVEDLLNRIRHYTGKSTNPTHGQFITSLKTIVYNDLVLPNSKGEDIIDSNLSDDIEEEIII